MAGSGLVAGFEIRRRKRAGTAPRPAWPQASPAARHQATAGPPDGARDHAQNSNFRTLLYYKSNREIGDIRATTVTVPLESPLRHANGCHWGRFVRTIVEVETDNGLIGLGEMGGGGESAEAVFRAISRTWWATTRPASKRCDSSSPTLLRRFITTGPSFWPRWSSPASTFWARPGVFRFPISWAAVCASRVRLRPIAFSAIPTPAAEPVKFAASTNWWICPRLKAALRIHQSQDQGRSLSARLRTRSLSRARRGVSQRFAALRSERRLVHRTGHPLRPGH